MVMEYVEGGDCATLLKSMGPLPSDLARLYFAETVLAVEYLHSYGIVHRDLKPDNLLITGMGHIKLTDFGLSKVGLMNLATNLYEGYLDRDTKQFNDKQVFGTPEYIAPEVILRQGYGKPVDWWSVGIILYEFLIGCVPFFGETPEELFAHVINDEIEWPEDEDWPLPDEAKHLISQLLQQNPLERLGTSGAHEVKEHGFFNGLNWDACLRQKAEFVPQLEDDEDTSYFDTRTDRYNHELDDSEEQEETDESMFSSFSSCSPRYHKVYSRIEKELAQERLLKSSSTSSIVDESTISKPSSPSESSLSRTKSLNEGRTTPVILSEKHTPTTSTISEIPTSSKSTTISTPELSHASATESVQNRRRSITKCSLPRFSISVEEERSSQTPVIREMPSDESDRPCISLTSLSQSLSYPTSPRISVASSTSMGRVTPKSRAVIKSASASGLSLIIPGTEELAARGLTTPHMPSPGNSSTSSRDASPNRDINHLGCQLKPPIIIRKGARGFGFTLKAIRVYYGDTDVYTVHHLIMAVENNSPAFEAGLRPGNLITHINGEPIQGLMHPQVLQLVLSGGDKINIRTTPLENTTIKTGGRKRNPVTSKMIRRPTITSKHRKGPPVKRSDSDKSKRRSSLLRRLSSKRASAEIQQLMASSCGTPSSPVLTPSKSYQSFSRSLASSNISQKDSMVSSTHGITPSPPSCHLAVAASSGRLPRSPPTNNRLQYTPSDSSQANSSQSSSPGSSVPNSPANLSNSPHFSRPSTLHGLKHKLVQTFRSPRRKSCGHIPLSPLARTPSPSVLPLVAATSPTARSPSPLTFPPGHQPGSSQTTQAFVLQKSLSSTAATSSGAETKTTNSIVSSLLSSSVKKSCPRPKSAEPGSPLFRRSLSPDRGRSLLENEAHPKSPLIRTKRDCSAHVSPLATTSSPSLSKVAVTNCFVQNSSRQLHVSDITDAAKVKSEPAKQNTKLVTEKGSASSSALVDIAPIVDKKETKTETPATYRTTVSIVLSSKSKNPSTVSLPEASSSTKGSKKEKKEKEPKAEKSGLCSPISIRKSLFKSDKRSKSTSRTSSSTSLSKLGTKDSK